MGQTKGQLVQVNLTASTDLRSLDDFRKLVIRDSGGTLVRLEDVANVVLGADTYDQEVRFSGERAVFMGVWVLPNANSLDVIARVNAEIKTIQSELPSGMSASVAFDSTKYIRSALDEVVHTLLETVLIVMVVIFLFLGSFRTVLVPVVAIPVSLIGAVFLMQAFGFTLNLLTILAVVLAVGLVVDDAIGGVENVERHMREGKTPLGASLVGARELVGPIIAMTVTLAAVYVPIGFQGGLTGSLFREFAFTLAGAVFISGIVALTLSPMMSSRLLTQSHGGVLAGLIDRAFEWVRRTYTRALGATLRARPAVYTVWAVLSLLIVPLYMFSPKELAPAEDQGVIFGAIDVPPNATLERLMPFVDQIQRDFASTPEFDHSFQITFPGGGFGGLLVKPWDERTRNIFAIQEEIAPKLNGITGVRAPAFLPSALPNAGTFPVEFVIASTASHEEIVRFAQQLVQEAAKSGQFAFPPITDVRIDQEKTDLVIDRDKVASMGLTMQSVGADLSSMLSGNFVNRFSIDGRSYKVIPQIERAGAADRGRARGYLPHGAGRAGRSVERGRDDPRGPRAADAESVPAAQRGEDLGRRASFARRGPEGPGGRGRQSPAGGLPHGLHGRIAAAARGVGQVSTGDGARAPPHLLGARRSVQLVPGSVRHSGRLRAALAMFGALSFTFLQSSPGHRACTSTSPRAGRRRSTSTRRSASSRSWASCRRTASSSWSSRTRSRPAASRSSRQ